MRKLLHVLEYIAVRGLEAMISAPPLAFALRGAERAGLAFKYILAKRDALVMANLRLAYPDKPEADLRLIGDGVWRNIGRTAVEFIRVDEVLHPDRVKVDGREAVEAAFAEGKGVILVAAHYCNWEFAGIIFQRFVRDFVAIARPMKNPYVETWLRAKRSSTGLPIILHREAVRASFRRLRHNGGIGIICDQNLYTGGAFVNFFGLPAATTTLPALLHIRTGAPVFLGYTVREGKNFKLILEPIPFPVTSDEEHRVEAETQTINDAIERIVRARPDWWFWIHNRWKRSPALASAVTP